MRSIFGLAREVIEAGNRTASEDCCVQVHQRDHNNWDPVAAEERMPGDEDWFVGPGLENTTRMIEINDPHERPRLARLQSIVAFRVAKELKAGV
jgi:hypothetical protein